MELSVTPGEVETYARNLQSWSSQIRDVHSHIKGNTETLERHWNDPQFNMFVEVINRHNINLDKAVESFEELSAALIKIARSMEENIRLQRQELGRFKP